MTTVALVGGDGSGKSTLAESLLTNFPLPTTYIYMGANLESSNYALPWSRLALRLKLRNMARLARQEGIADPDYVSTHHMRHRQRSSSLVRTVLRLSNRLLEVGYRNAVSLRWQRKGHVVVFDRHFIFDTFITDQPLRDVNNIEKANRIYHWLLLNVFPVPDLILFLDADPDIMFARKREASPDYLRERNDHWRNQGKAFDSFVVLDANQTAEQVYEDAKATIVTYVKSTVNSSQIVSPAIEES